MSVVRVFSAWGQLGDAPRILDSGPLFSILIALSDRFGDGWCGVCSK